MWELEGRPRHYAWGSTTAIPKFLQQEVDGRPWAELWYGAHPSAPSTIRSGGPLDAAIARDPHALLGSGVVAGFGQRLPFLLKLIAPARPLSLQVHPTREHARESFAAENAAGLSPDSPLRNYRDANHKPEVILALTRFEALCGFRTPRRAAEMLEGLDTALTDRMLGLLRSSPSADGMRKAFRMLIAPALRPGPDQVETVARACAERLTAGSSASPRIDGIVGMLQAHHPGDVGVVAALLLNPVTLLPGEAMYVPAGTIHAYLSGTGIEVMASSDNVLRAGLTAKKIDAEEMLACVRVVAAPPVRIAPEHRVPGTVAYSAPIDDFELLVSTIHGAQDAPGAGPRILLGLVGQVRITSREGSHVLEQGRAVFLGENDGPVRASGEGRFVQVGMP